MTDAEKLKILRDGILTIMSMVPSQSAIYDIGKETLAISYRGAENDSKPNAAPSKPADIPFDLEKAKRGEKIEWKVGEEWKDVKFLGVATDLNIVFEYCCDEYKCELAKTTREYLRMAPIKMRKVYVQFYYDRYIVSCTQPYDTPDEAFKSLSDGFPPSDLIGDPIEIEIPDTRQ